MVKKGKDEVRVLSTEGFSKYRYSPDEATD
jgi:hypothetical protein